MEKAINRKENKILKNALITLSILFLVLMLIVPLIIIISGALSEGFGVYIKAITDNYTFKAMKLTFTATIISIILNTIFGICVAWAMTKFKFKGKNLLGTLIDLPFAIPPVVVGLLLILTFGRGTFLGDLLRNYDIRMIFTTHGIILATLFVTFPFVAREIIPLMNTQGTDEEEAAAMMGASGFYIFRKITLPNIKWGLIYGIILCTARTMGEFGAVSVVSGHIAGRTNTLPLHVEILYNDYQFAAAFAVSSILVITAVIILILRNIVEYKAQSKK
ncbi:sulfate ABC transporter permease subunit CysW [Clostridium beijerinckii]|uniref:Sulfate transport system permease protein n=1 Tax=Clostridium beijerinckii TaxID=1520 RepID=A0AAX0B1X0_CLOBE|nr:sulfate transport system permease protein [Clostridium beijerinckii]NYC74387.1 sulfate transport system permease protein [Clostridium beijerinckii]